MRPKTLPLILVLLSTVSCAQKDLPEPCYEKPASGKCKASHKRFYHEVETNTCKPFIWGGCGGNVPFDSLKLCKSTCNAAGPEDGTGHKKAVPQRPTEQQ